MLTIRPPAASLWRAPTTGQVRLCSGGQLPAAVPQLAALQAGHAACLSSVGAQTAGEWRQPGGGAQRLPNHSPNAPAVRIFSFNGGHSRDVYHTKRMQRVFAVRFSGDGTYVFSGGAAGLLVGWRME